MASKGNQVRITFFDNGLGRIRLKTTGSNNFPSEGFAQLLCRDRRLALGDECVAFDPGLNNVEIREPEAVQRFCKVIEECGRIAVIHPVKRSAGSNANGDSVTAIPISTLLKFPGGTSIDPPYTSVR
jgi:hypothetical protein